MRADGAGIGLALKRSSGDQKSRTVAKDI